jgi:hypothetical protein
VWHQFLVAEYALDLVSIVQEQHIGSPHQAGQLDNATILPVQISRYVVDFFDAEVACVTEANVMSVAEAVRYCLFVTLRLFNDCFNGQRCVANKKGMIILKSMDPVFQGR